MEERYDPEKIEAEWQAEWERTDLYRAGADPARPKYYILEMFPYPSGAGLSVGHLHNYVPCDVIGRYKRMKGFNVLHPMGWDAFGLPAENEAILKGSHPTETVPRYAANFKRQLTISGCAYDWSREINSSAPEYYKWTQWFFLLLYKRGLAYRATGAQWWCDKCRTILANEQVVNGCCWRHPDNPVSKKDLEQWYIKITDYADRLLADLDKIDWPEPIKLMQRNWIGRSEGAELGFPITGNPGKEVRFFTTRPDTVFGVSLMVLAPEHPLVAEITTPAQRAAVEAYASDARRQSEIERMSTAKEKTGVFTGAYAHNVFTDKDIPIWIADYVLMGYGTGAIMGAPGEDQRDFEFATKYGIEIPRVTAPVDGSEAPGDRAFIEQGVAINSGFLDGMPTADAIKTVARYAEDHEIGRATVTYRMRDWLISRQRYWGCPIPMMYCKNDCGVVPVPEDQLPVMLPAMTDYLPSGTARSPLANVAEFVHTTCPRCGGPAERETDTLDGFACSSWYFMRFADPHDDREPFARAAVDYWLPVDLYVGGAEHAVMHLLYARMWTKVMFDAGMINFDEPFPMLRNQGMVWATDGSKMSKSKGNVVTPDSMIEKYGADALRLWELFMSPYDEATNWNESGVSGTLRFITRVWSMMRRYVEAGCPDGRPSEGTLKQTHKAIEKVTDHIERLRFNTALATLMDHLNYVAKLTPEEMGRFVAESFVVMLAPMAPHVSEELWRELGHRTSVHLERWPEFDANLVRDEMATVVVQINGKVRDRLQVAVGAEESQVRDLALRSEAVIRNLAGKTPRKFIFVKDKMLSIVA
ncbi:MAG: leucine--tRNA ligase [Candidatus Binatus sp.]|uniref:leucine--tRNA ligase n=1 Tax=Candidatus Binatus sp. TaxID=2811406 RepID=UPI002716A848|nr:leucine--tRNA ligase [Candidatus Binatus sp.]MDO8433483.1 leucine--tRNA ligase [Candidatus Binatus sp.]